MILQRITDFLLRGRLQAMGTAFALTFVPLIGTVSMLIAALVTLRKGAQEGALVMVAATLPVLLWYTSVPADQPGYALGILNVVIMIVVVNVLTWIFAVILRQFSSWSWVLQLAGLLGILTVIILHVIYPDVQSQWQVWLTDYFTAAQQSVNMDGANTKDIISPMIASMKAYATGFVASVLIFYALLQVLIARWWQDKIFNPNGLRKELLAIRLSYAAGVVFLIGSIAALMMNRVAIDALPILYMIFGCAGLSVLHFLTATSKKSWLWTVLVYTALTIMPLTSGLLVALIAWFDIGLDFRHDKWRVNKFN